ncbi:Uncharacterized protein Fot_17379 [Forsythia ovata]|uniref:Uncharacterized protein n=1 Tax=Forsythia ovata TaxID=205694 RepID=A0ABD1VGJ3_9LAMI
MELGFSDTCHGLFLFGAEKTRKHKLIQQLDSIKHELINLLENLPTTERGLEVVGKIGLLADVELDIGEETCDFPSMLDLLTSLESSFLEEEPCDCPLIPYNTSAISISTSSGFKELDFDDAFRWL